MSGSVYILGGMRGYQYYNFPSFDAMRDQLENDGYKVCSPADIDRVAGFDAFELPPDYDWNTIPDTLDIHTIIRRDVLAILDKCDKYATLSGWEKSTGARAEKALLDWKGAKWLNKPARETVCQEAQRLTHSDRNTSYGHPLDNFCITIDMLNARFRGKLKEPFTIEEFAEIQIICKLGRQANSSKRDNLVDIAGYANTHQMVVDERERRAQKKPLNDFETIMDEAV
jgi:hypothetical protein